MKHDYFLLAFTKILGHLSQMQYKKPISFWIKDIPILLDCFVVIGDVTYARKRFSRELKSFVRGHGLDICTNGYADGGRVAVIFEDDVVRVCSLWVNWIPANDLITATSTIAHECVHWVDWSLDSNGIPQTAGAGTECRAQLVSWCVEQILHRLTGKAFTHPRTLFQ